MLSENSNEHTFSLGICMAGAVSAGAYTAGVMDYLVEALEEWEKQRGQPGVPTHRVVIPVIGGASAGGMTGIITAAALNNKITHIDKATGDILAEHPENKLYHAWVDLTDRNMFKRMLETSDIRPGHVVSGLNSAFIDEIAKNIVKVDRDAYRSMPPYFAKDLKVFTTLTNLDGIEHDVTFRTTAGTSKYYMQAHNDYACFEITDGKKQVDPLRPFNGGWMPLSFKDNLNADIARDAAMATGAFPMGLKSRILTRQAGYVNDSPFMGVDKGITPLPDGAYQTLNVDGGMINNEPFEKVREVLSKLTGQEDEKEYQKYNTFKSTVLMIEPFPTGKAEKYVIRQDLLSVMGSTLSAMLGQVRSKPSNIKDAMASGCAGQFLITPVRQIKRSDGSTFDAKGEAAIACGALDGFSGFMSKEFRVHDYFLGRYNCKIFLRDYFTIPADAEQANPIFKNGYSDTDPKLFRSRVDKTRQIIPIFEEATNYDFPDTKFSCGGNWPVISEEAIDDFRDELKERIHMITTNVIRLNKVMKFFLWLASKFILSRALTNMALNTIKKQLNAWQLMKLEEDENL